MCFVDQLKSSYLQGGFSTSSAFLHSFKHPAMLPSSHLRKNPTDILSASVSSSSAYKPCSCVATLPWRFSETLPYVLTQRISVALATLCLFHGLLPALRFAPLGFSPSSTYVSMDYVMSGVLLFLCCYSGQAQHCSLVGISSISSPWRLSSGLSS